MMRPLRKTLVLAVLAVHATFVVCGPGLHALPGLEHAATTPRGNPPEATHFPGTGSTSADDCPVCHFLAQGQVTVDPPDGPAVAVETDRCVVHSTPRVLISKRLLTRLRAPPLSSSLSA
jgi:hypothetical protein